MSWGVELWDRYDSVVNQVSQSSRELDTWYGSFFKERSKIENEYARSLRKLIKTYMPKDKKKNNEDESTQTNGFRLILVELGYQAGQHELLADTYGKECSKGIDDRLKEVKKEMKKNKKEAETIEKSLSQSYKSLDNRKLKYQKAHTELELTSNTFKKTESDGTISRHEVDKMRAMTNKKTRESDDTKAQYAHQLIQTNKSQQEYYHQLLPAVLNNLQNLAIGNCEFFKNLISKCVKHEKDVAPIVVKCHEEMENVIGKINAKKDSEITINRLKTGSVPPADFMFEELMPGMEIKSNAERKNSMSRGRSKQALNVEKGNINYFQRKRELEKKIEAQESDVLKGQKEMKSLQLMIQTYTQNPKFGDAKQFQGELDAAAQKVQLLESELHAMQTELVDVNNTLENMKNQSPSINIIRREKSPSGSLASSLLSAQVSVSSTSGSLDGGQNNRHHQGPDSGIYLTGNTTGQTSEGEEDIYDDLSAPSPSTENTSKPSLVGKYIALYEFESDSDDTIPMAEGEEFFLIDDDQDGWTKVKRVDNRFFQDIGEGFVPTSFIQSLT
eukprot:GFUD01069205.1.p1 GENE.GFUD01069205.1~~GFUD01069205.1.p1  ORF type:complete len:558 (+),score=166.38 GFUD01069205.1:488-2161(+)